MSQVMSDYDTILCRDKEDAKQTLESVGGENIVDWEFLDSGEVRLILNCRLRDLAESEEQE